MLQKNLEQLNSDAGYYVYVEAPVTGATGDGSTDDAGAIYSRAVDATGGTLVFSPVTYICKSPVTVPLRTTFDLNGATLKFTPASDVADVLPLNGSTIKNGTIWNAGTGSPGVNFQTPIRIGHYATGSGVSKVRLSNLILRQDQNARNVIAVYGDSSDIDIEDITVADNQNSTGFCVMIHWGNTDDVASYTTPTAGVSKHPHDVRINGLSVGSWGNLATLSTDGGVLGISGAYNVTARGVEAQVCRVGALVTAGDVSSDFAPSNVSGFLLRGIDLQCSFHSVKENAFRVSGQPAASTYSSKATLDAPVTIHDSVMRGTGVDTETAIILTNVKGATVRKNDVHGFDAYAVALRGATEALNIEENNLYSLNRTAIYSETYSANSQEINYIKVRNNRIYACNRDQAASGKESVFVRVSGQGWLIDGNVFGQSSGESATEAIRLESTSSANVIGPNVHVAPVAANALTLLGTNHSVNYSYGTLNLATNGVRLSVRTQSSLNSTNLLANELAFSLNASGATAALRSGGTVWYFSSSASTLG